MSTQLKRPIKDLIAACARGTTNKHAATDLHNECKTALVLLTAERGAALEKLREIEAHHAAINARQMRQEEDSLTLKLTRDAIAVLS